MSETSYSSTISQERRQKERRRFRGTRNFWAQYRKSKFGLVGLLTFILFFLAALFAPWIAPYSPNAQGQFDKVHPAFAEPELMGIFDPEGSQNYFFMSTEGRFDSFESETVPFSLVNNSEQSGFTIRVQRSKFLLAVDVETATSTTVEARSMWENVDFDFLDSVGISFDAEIINDPFKEGNQMLHLKFDDNGSTEAAPTKADFSFFNLYPDYRFYVVRSSVFYRIRLEYNSSWDVSGFIPKQLFGYHRYFMLGPTDDWDLIAPEPSEIGENLTINPLFQNISTIYEMHPQLNVTRNFGTEVLEDKYVEFTADMRNENYWIGDGIGADCPAVKEVKVSDVIVSKCEHIEKKASNRPYKHSIWSSSIVKRPLVDNADVSTSPTDKTQLFGQEGPLVFGLNLEFRQNSTVSTGRYDIFLDDIFYTTGIAYSGILGADNQGQDVFSILVWGSQASLTVGILATIFSLTIGIVVGLASGYAGGFVDDVIMRFVDFLLIMPGLPLLLALAAILKPSIWNLIIVIAALGWPGTARLIRSQVLVEKEKAYVESAKAAGASDTYILFKHILPNVLPLVFAIAATQVSGAILSLAALDYLGLGDAFTVSWGLMLQDASRTGAASSGYWWLVVSPGLCIAALSLAFALMGYTTQQIVNPRLRSKD